MKSADGQNLREMLGAATRWLERNVSFIDALNVFPVPDGDTGTNMLLTMKSSINAAAEVADNHASRVADAVAHGALIGARGNSGVILSQIWQGLALGFKDKAAFTARDLAAALPHSQELAYRGVSRPVEGTILTVIKDITETARQEISEGDIDLVTLLEAVVLTARDSVANTPNLLAVLREAGVVDAGGQGLYTILQGILRFVKGDRMEEETPEIVSSGIAGGEISGIQPPEELFGFCTEFMINGEDLDIDSIRSDLNGMGQSLAVVGSSSQVRVHIHTEHPGAVIHHASTFGETRHVSVRNMEEQHRAYTAMRNHTIRNPNAPSSDVSVIAVTLGDGLAEVFASLGAMAVISGGQTMNPSTGELAEAVESVPCSNVILLPNNKNVAITANQVQAVTGKEIAVVPTENIPQGVAALIAYHADSDFCRNVEAMTEAIEGIQTIEIIPSVRNAKFGGFDIRRGQAMGFLEGDLMAVGDESDGVLKKVLADMDLGNFELVTLYRGADVEEAAAQSLTRELENLYSHLQFELIYGGQPFTTYIVSVE